MPAAARKSTTAKKAAPKVVAPTAATDEVAAPATMTPGDEVWLAKHQALAAGDVPTALQAEVDLEDIPDGAIAVPLGDQGDIVHIMPRRTWRASALSALHAGDLEKWASLCLLESDYQRVWVGLDPTIDEIQDMMRAWAQLTGEPDPGKALVPRGSLRNGRRS